MTEHHIVEWTSITKSKCSKCYPKTDSDNKKWKWGTGEKGTNSVYIINDNRDDGYMMS